VTAPRGTDEPAALPAELSSLVESVVVRTKLWRRERAEVRRELVAHFADGLESGASASELRENFGDPKAAAKLIRRSKKRNRPLWWRATAGTVKAGAKAGACVLALMFIAYAAMFVMYNTGKPNVTRNYVAELRAEVDAIPEEDRAWPVYLEAIRALRANGYDQKHDQGAWRVAETREEAMAWVERHREGIALIREAASRPALGYPVSPDVDPRLTAIYDEFSGKITPVSNQTIENPQVVSILLPYLAELKRMTAMLWADAHAAISANDSDRLERNIAAMFGMAEQSREGAYLISDLVGVSIAELAMQTVREAIVSEPGWLDDDALRRIAHRVGAFPADGRVIRLDGERLFMDDFLQRFYTDDGNGGGLPTYEGMRLLESLSDGPQTDWFPDAADRLFGPVSIATFADRRELKEEYDRLIGLTIAENQTPLWKRGLSVIDQEMESLSYDFLRRQRFMILYALLPSFNHALLQAEFFETARAATTGAIAAELHRRRSGQWPATWSDVVLDLLPAPPIDRFTGEPLRLRVVDGSLRIYSVGADKDDDAGAPTVDSEGNVMNDAARRWRPGRADEAADWDWVLFPPGPVDPGS